MTHLAAEYPTRYFDSHVAGALTSARAVLPLVLELVSVRSAVDVGCGVGAWISVLMELGVADVVGVDGSHVPSEQLLFPRPLFVPHDLARDTELGRTFDLAMSLEVAEHLPMERAEAFVDFLARLAPVVLFSAAIPGQGGVGHVNERWQEYWATLFAARHYVSVDAIRHRVWTNDDVEPWYAQNVLIFASPRALTESRRLREAAEIRDRPMNVVHPRMFDIYRQNWLPPPERLLRQLPQSIAYSLGFDRLRSHLKRYLRRRV
jgi:SAM-dependent methyltransferase